LVDHFQAPLKISKEKKLSEPVVPQPIVNIAMNDMIETMTKSFKDLNISIGALMKQNTSHR
jgi:hypothetical protein